MKFFIIISFITILFIYGWSLNRKNAHLEREKRLKEEEEEENRKKRIEEINKKQKDALLIVIENIRDFFQKFDDFKNQRKYIASSDIYNFKTKFENLFQSTKEKEYKHLSNFNKEINLIDKFLIEFENISHILELRNTDFVNEELIRVNFLLNDIEGKSLDSQQRKAVIIDEDNQLVIAGAGSGKTTTIAGKVKYLTEVVNINPENILLISFTRKSAEEMMERIHKKMDITIPVKTFHKLGLDIISSTNNLKPSIYEANSKTHLEILASFINNAKSNEEYFSKLINFLAFYLKPYKDPFEFNSDADHNNYLNEQKLEGYKLVEKINAQGEIIKYRERFKSQEEVYIANFLFCNNINYEYEEKYKYKTASKNFSQYKPDFYLPDYDIYIEHFGITENGDVPEWFKGKDGLSAKEIYNNGINWKRQEHFINGTTLIETYSWHQKKGVLFSELKRKLENKGVIFDPIPNEDIWKYVQENTPEDIDTFTQLINTFLVLYKSNNERISNLRKKAVEEDNERAILFLDIFEPIFNSYENFLKQNREIDFSDMINLANEIVFSGQYQSNYEYIIIDEFQDISKSRYHLIKSLLDQNHNTKLFCVGDDWQSIYRFAGSDIGIFTNFQEYFKKSSILNFERKTHISYIENTYRFNNKLIELSSNFILKNPNQLSKTLNSNIISSEEPFTVYKYLDNERNAINLINSLEKALEDINKIEKNKNVSVLLLGRYDFERKNINNTNILKEKYNKINERYEYKSKTFENLDIYFLTAHRSKGLEADYVIILNGNSGTYGFPSEISDDPLLNFLLSKADQFPNGEERRLFYVALTRTKKHVYILSSKENTSKFLDEIVTNEIVTTLKCEWCDNGKLIERKGPYGMFYACNNSHYCNYTRKINDSDLYEIGKNLFEEKKYDTALEYFKNAILKNPEYYDAIYFIGRCYYAKKEFKKALLNYQLAKEKGFKHSYIYYNLGITYYKLEDYNKAIENFLYYDKNNDNKLLVNSFLAVAYFRTRHFVLALEYVNKEIIRSNNGKDALLLKDKILSTLKDKYLASQSNVKSEETSIIRGYIDLAIKLDLLIKFDYHKSEQFDGGVKSLRTIKPKEFKWIGNSECVVGYCYMRQEDRTFNISRISNLVMSPKEIEYWD